MLQRLTLLGSTGSIGESTLDVVERHPDRFSVYALSAHRNWQKLAEQCVRVRPEVAVVGDAESATALAMQLRAHGLSTEVAYGADALVQIAAAARCETVVAAIVGAAGLPSALAAARAGKRILLANKEALVMSGALFIEAVREHRALLLPVDSEHNAIYQCLPLEHRETAGGDADSARGGVVRLVLTASGGPFRERDPATLVDVTPDEACAHPNWEMGRKISVDSATMMNKGLEVIEAHWLFGLAPDRIEVLIHPQSVIHSMVSYADGSVLAQLGNPDMRTPIAHALAYPDRIASGVAQLDLAAIGRLTFEAPNPARFPCLQFAFDALREGGTASTLLNAANEVAVEAFLAHRLGFADIAAVVAHTLDALPSARATSLDAVFDSDAAARRTAAAEIARRGAPAVRGARA